MADKQLKWFDVWMDNYTNRTEVAQEVTKLAKSSFKGDIYIPWAVMLKALYALDENAVVEKVQNDKGGYVHTDYFTLWTKANGNESEVTVVSHMVKVKVTFMGKEFEDVFPIQDKDYSSTKVFDQNLVNRALQRNMTRVIAMATGVAWSLYESGDLQMDTPEENKMEQLKQATEKPVKKAPAKSKKKVEVENDLTLEPQGTVTDIDANLGTFLVVNRTVPKVMGLMSQYNTFLSKKLEYEGEPLAFDLSNDSDEVILAKANLIDKPEMMLNALKKVV